MRWFYFFGWQIWKGQESVESYSTNYLDVSPSKKQPLPRRVVSSSVNSNPTVNPCSSTTTTISSGTTDTGLAQLSRYTSPDSTTDMTFHTFDENPAVQGQSYSDRQRKAAEHCSEIRDYLQRVLVESRIPPINSKCMMCDELAVAICDDCSSTAFFL